MRTRPFRYLLAYTLPALVLLGFWLQGWWLFLPLLYLYGLLPLLELILPASTDNLSPDQEHAIAQTPMYDWLLYLAVPVQFAVLFAFLLLIPSLQGVALIGAVISMGLMCGSFGINIGHELGHRATPRERLMAKMLLLTSLNMHFFIEHNSGHHRRVATEEDPASARRGEPLYLFWWRSIRDSYRSAWQLEAKRLDKSGQQWFSLRNEMLVFQLVQVAFVLLIALVFGPKAALCFIAAAIMGILLLETINYIEHYGLRRQLTESGRYERVMPIHSWNSNHMIGRMTLFELSRHSDHHFRASRKYPVLRHHEDSPQMPTGYPGMMLLACVPPLWFRVMHPRLARLADTVKNTAVSTTE
ncbi:Alkane 1-monooxygenase [Microbulbifer aggregans]|uniref:Alkane 1-monooxygenase n=1 Tax=Microbulbifer aggregans TaxID=1769779 RepID=A0A1C9W956_9GAMM|nr:alkane 1-monooxygenase [Microbulbifer aggregans]AOS97696.1 Alkane 1-monooxygenase [Microbulbifer aggregans]